MQHPTIIPAQAGYFVVVKSADPGNYWPDPILAWAVHATPGGSRYMLPITLEEGELESSAYILRPDGRITWGIGEGLWDTLADWLNDETVR